MTATCACFCYHIRKRSELGFLSRFAAEIRDSSFRQVAGSVFLPSRATTTFAGPLPDRFSFHALVFIGEQHGGDHRLPKNVLATDSVPFARPRKVQPVDQVSLRR